jgi:phospholipid/cholesterol/gamma-HCH transport system ATP-binding protein
VSTATPVPVFRLTGAVLPGGEGFGPRSDAGLALRVEPGTALCVTDAPRSAAALIADLLGGARFPAAGEAAFHGRSWAALSPAERARRQGMLRRLFAPPAWLGYLRTWEEILLLEGHHTERAMNAVMEEAAAWCRHFGLPGLPEAAPWTLSSLDRRRAALARVFLGVPRGIVLEEPLPAEAAPLAAPLQEAVHTALQRGAGVVSITAASSPGLSELACTSYRSLLHRRNEAPA